MPLEALKIMNKYNYKTHDCVLINLTLQQHKFDVYNVSITQETPKRSFRAATDIVLMVLVFRVLEITMFYTISAMIFILHTLAAKLKLVY
jgi:hypothetical protein